MKEKGYQLKGKDSSSAGTIAVEQKDGPPIVIDKGAKVYVAIYGGTPHASAVSPAYKYFHKKDCRHLWNLSVAEMTAEKAIARGKTMCPDCFRD